MVDYLQEQIDQLKLAVAALEDMAVDVVLAPGDLQIGAVENKDHTTDDRQHVDTDNRAHTRSQVQNDAGDVTDANPLQTEEQGTPLGYDTPNNWWLFQRRLEKVDETLIDVASITAGGSATGDSTLLGYTNVITVESKIAWGANVDGATVKIYASRDGLDWDTDPFVSGLEPTQSTGNTTKVTIPVDVEAIKYVRAEVVNLDAVNAIGNVDVNIVKAG